MKEFNLEQAKAGKPVCTRDGKPVRIICFDAKIEYPILGLITTNKNKELFNLWLENGRCYSSKEDDADLMMASEKHEGWVNIYNSHTTNDNYIAGSIYKTKENAMECCRDYKAQYIATIHIEWEE